MLGPCQGPNQPQNHKGCLTVPLSCPNQRPILRARARRRFSPQNRALGLSVFGNHIVVAKLVEAARAKLFSHRTARIERFENYPFMTDDHKSSFMFAKYYLFL